MDSYADNHKRIKQTQYITYVAHGSVVAGHAAARESVQKVFTCAAIHARVAGALVEIYQHKYVRVIKLYYGNYA